MRLWHKGLICVLPKQQLVSQWRECVCIAKNIKEKGMPNHILVNKIMQYDISHFYSYAVLVCSEMKSRGYRCDFERFKKYCDSEVFKSQPFENWHNKRYLTQCYYNLQEKYDCCGIKEDEWKKITERVSYLLKVYE